MKNEQAFSTDNDAPRVYPAFYWTIADTLVIAKRELKRISRNPDDIVGAIIVPIIFFVLFRYVFGGAISIPGYDYSNYLVAGVLVMTVFFSSGTVGLGVCSDLESGIIDRFVSLPMARSAVLNGRVLASFIKSFFILLFMLAFSVLLGFRPAGTVINYLIALGLLMLSCLAYIWFIALFALLVRSVESFGAIGPLFMLLFVFFSSGLVPTSTMPGWLQIYAKHQPFSLLIDAVRGLVLNRPDTSAIWQSTVWFVILILILVPLSVWVYGRRAAR
jgi:ABC-2 type transport system permease protein/oleandomycin transport system permease protein